MQRFAAASVSSVGSLGSGTFQNFDGSGLSKTLELPITVNVANTSIIQITAQGSDPNLVADFANAIAYETIVYVQDTRELYQLEFLDEAAVPGSPISNRTLYLVLGGVVALVLSMGVAFIADQLIVPHARVAGHQRRVDLPGLVATIGARLTNRGPAAPEGRPTRTGETLIAAANTDEESQN